ncbi:MAG: nucleotidyl transferase AbiEii/AbiGii toxin family protein [Pseudonocardiales bacterium]|nr:nucleotidyl transferase AbiEii/AbiGii toxin family protein [Pseudonocardiales bacterium]
MTLDSLRRQFSYDRLLTRIFAGPDAKRWVLKGATAILARLAGDARHTRDIDLYRQDDDLPAAENSCVPQPQPMSMTSFAYRSRAP